MMTNYNKGRTKICPPFTEMLLGNYFAAMTTADCARFKTVFGNIPNQRMPPMQIHAVTIAGAES